MAGRGGVEGGALRDRLTTASLPLVNVLLAGENAGDDHVAPFQPSPKLSLMVRVQTASSATMRLPVKGAPPEGAVPSAHATDHETSVG